MTTLQHSVSVGEKSVRRDEKHNAESRKKHIVGKKSAESKKNCSARKKHVESKQKQQLN
jgi:hypothetical protein